MLVALLGQCCGGQQRRSVSQVGAVSEQKVVAQILQRSSRQQKFAGAYQLGVFAEKTLESIVRRHRGIRVISSFVHKTHDIAAGDT